MPELRAALDAFMQEHRRCGELDGGVHCASEPSWIIRRGAARKTEG